MIKRTSILMFVALLFVACAEKKDAVVLGSRVDTLSWALGRSFADAMKITYGDKINYDVAMKAVQQTFNGGVQPISDEEYQMVLMAVSQSQQASMPTASAPSQSQSATRGKTIDDLQQEFFDDLKASNPNVKYHNSGFYYEVLKQGKGRNARIGDRIEFDYASYMMFDGKPYDGTYGVREPIVHVVGHPMFQGLIDGFQVMNAGSKYRFYFPYQLAFGTKGSGDIPGYTPFIYEVELHKLLD